MTTPDTDGRDGNDATYARSSGVEHPGRRNRGQRDPARRRTSGADDGRDQRAARQRSQREAGHEGREHRVAAYRHAEDEPQQTKPQDLIDESGASWRRNRSERGEHRLLAVVPVRHENVRLSFCLREPVRREASRPSGENIGNPSKVGLKVTCSSPVPSRLMRNRSKFRPFGLWWLDEKMMRRPSGCHDGAKFAPPRRVS